MAVFAVLVPTKTVGVMGDSRTYGNLIALRAVVSVDGMTADWYRMPNQILEEVSSKIVNSVNGINRVVYDISSKPPSTIEWNKLLTFKFYNYTFRLKICHSQTEKIILRSKYVCAV